MKYFILTGVPKASNKTSSQLFFFLSVSPNADGKQNSPGVRIKVQKKW